MRDYEYRGKSIHNGWVYGSYISRGHHNYIYDLIIDYKSIKKAVMPETVGQYIGSADTNGKKMYEGDIVDYWNPNGDYIGREVIEYAKGTGYEIRTPFVEEYDLTTIGWAIKDGYTFEIVGNKHDNQGLLKEVRK